MLAGSRFYLTGLDPVISPIFDRVNCFLDLKASFWDKTSIHGAKVFSLKNFWARAHFCVLCARKNFWAWPQKRPKNVFFGDFSYFRELVARAEMHAVGYKLCFWIQLIQKIIFAPWMVKKFQKLIINFFVEIWPFSKNPLFEQKNRIFFLIHFRIFPRVSETFVVRKTHLDVSGTTKHIFIVPCY